MRQGIEGAKGKRMVRPRYMSLQAGRGIAALLVVVQHASTFAGVVPGLWVYPSISRWLMGFKLGVAFFFVLSGIVILMSHWQDIDRPSSVPMYLWKRFRRIYPIYWVVLIPVVCMQLALDKPQFAFRHDPWMILSSFLLIHIHSGVETNLVVAWTLFIEVLFYAMFASLLLNRRFGIVVLTLWFAMSGVNLFHRPLFMPILFSRLHLLFAMGMLVAWLLRNHKVRGGGTLLASGGVILVGTFLYGGWRGSDSDWVYLCAGAGTACVLLGAAELERSNRLKTPRVLSDLGDASYAIYLVHFPVIAVVARLCFRLDRQVHVPIWLWMVVLIAVGTGAGWLLHVCVERPLLRWLGSRGSVNDTSPSARSLRSEGA